MNNLEQLRLDSYLKEGANRIQSGQLTKGETLVEVAPYEGDPPPETRARRFGAALLDELIGGVAQTPGANTFKNFLIKLLVKAILVAIRAVFK